MIFQKKSIIHKLILRFVCNKASVVLSTSHAMAKEFLDQYPKLNRPIVTPFGVNINKFIPLQDEKSGSQIRVGMVKKLEYNYGVDIFIKAASIVLEKNPDKDICFEVVGGGSQEKELKQLVKQIEIEDNFFFKGWLDNNSVPDFLNSLDIFVVPSRNIESFGVAAVEAQACGLPVIVSDIGGLPEVVEDGYTGFLCPPEDINSLADFICTLISNPKLRKEIGEAGRSRVIKKYNWEESVDQVESVYSTLSSKRV